MKPIFIVILFLAGLATDGLAARHRVKLDNKAPRLECKGVMVAPLAPPVPLPAVVIPVINSVSSTASRLAIRGLQVSPVAGGLTGPLALPGTLVSPVAAAMPSTVGIPAVVPAVVGGLTGPLALPGALVSPVAAAMPSTVGIPAVVPAVVGGLTGPLALPGALVSPVAAAMPSPMLLVSPARGLAYSRRVELMRAFISDGHTPEVLQMRADYEGFVAASEERATALGKPKPRGGSVR
jgi:hypothetical protein